MAKLWIMSDLHLETVPYPRGFKPQATDFDVLIAAGDIWEGNCKDAFHLLEQLAQGKPVVFVMGNHEYWNQDLTTALHTAKIHAEKHNITLLDNSSAMLAGCQFIGTTLWTDYALAGDLAIPMAKTGELIEVKHNGATRRLTIADTIALHTQARDQLAALIANADQSQPLIVVTHHAPHSDCLPEYIHGTWRAGNAASDLSHLTDTGQVRLWIHGHLHKSVDMIRPGGTRIFCNPGAPMFSNPAFHEALIIDLNMTP